MSADVVDASASSSSSLPPFPSPLPFGPVFRLHAPSAATSSSACLPGLSPPRSQSSSIVATRPRGRGATNRPPPQPPSWHQGPNSPAGGVSVSSSVAAARLGGLPGSVGIPGSVGRGCSVGLLLAGGLLSVGRGRSVGLSGGLCETLSVEPNAEFGTIVGDDTKIGMPGGVGILLVADESCGGLVGSGVADGSIDDLRNIAARARDFFGLLDRRNRP